MGAVTVTGGTGYIGRSLIQRLVARGDAVTALVRPGSRSRAPTGATIVEGSALAPDDVARAMSPGCTLILLVGTPHPNPSKAAQFQSVDLESVKAAAGAIRLVKPDHIIYVSVAHPAPIMKAFIQARKAAERILKDTRLPLTVLRPWYVVGPGHWWPLMLTPLYKVLEGLPSTRDTAARLGLVKHDQMVTALAAATTATLPAPFRVLDVAAIRAVKP